MESRRQDQPSAGPFRGQVQANEQAQATPWALRLIDVLEVESARLAARRLPDLPLEQLVIQAGRDIDEKIGRKLAGIPPPPIDLGQAAEAIGLAAANGTLDQLDRRTWRAGPWCLRLGQPPIAERLYFKDKFFVQADQTQARSFQGALVRAFLVDKHQGDPFHLRLGEYLLRKVPTLQWAWARPERRPIFEADCHNKITQAVMGQEDPFASLVELGFAGDLSTEAFARQVFMRCIRLVAGLYGNPTLSLAALKRLEAFAFDGNRFRFQGHADVTGCFFNELLTPFGDGTLKEKERKEVTRLFTSRFGHPQRNASQWSYASREARQAILRQLAIFAIDRFFTLLSDTSESHMWPARKRFWMDYFERNMISDAWVVLGKDGQRLARKTEDSLAFGSLYGALKDQAVLLMRIGDLIVAEWNHSGKCRIWRDGASRMPRLYEDGYDAARLKDQSDFHKTHDASGHWMADVRQFIRTNTGYSAPVGVMKPAAANPASRAETRSRPFLSLTTKELEKLAEETGTSDATLEDILYELAHRKKTLARELEERILNILNGRGRSISSKVQRAIWQI